MAASYGVDHSAPAAPVGGDQEPASRWFGDAAHQVTVLDRQHDRVVLSTLHSPGPREIAVATVFEDRALNGKHATAWSRHFQQRRVGTEEVQIDLHGVDRTGRHHAAACPRRFGYGRRAEAPQGLAVGNLTGERGNRDCSASGHKPRSCSSSPP